MRCDDACFILISLRCSSIKARYPDSESANLFSCCLGMKHQIVIS